MESHRVRVRPLAVQVGDVNLYLGSGDVEMLVDAIDRLVEGMVSTHAGNPTQPDIASALQTPVLSLQEVRRLFVRSSGTLADPPLKLDRSERRLPRTVLAHITGYQRGDLTPGLRQVRQIILDNVPGWPD